jgi:hypothetical protein
MKQRLSSTSALHACRAGWPQRVRGMFIRRQGLHAG